MTPLGYYFFFFTTPLILFSLGLALMADLLAFLAELANIALADFLLIPCLRAIELATLENPLCFEPLVKQITSYTYLPLPLFFLPFSPAAFVKIKS